MCRKQDGNFFSSIVCQSWPNSIGKTLIQRIYSKDISIDHCLPPVCWDHVSLLSCSHILMMNKVHSIYLSLICRESLRSWCYTINLDIGFLNYSFDINSNRSNFCDHQDRRNPGTNVVWMSNTYLWISDFTFISWSKFSSRSVQYFR